MKYSIKISTELVTEAITYCTALFCNIWHPCRLCYTFSTSRK